MQLSEVPEGQDYSSVTMCGTANADTEVNPNGNLSSAFPHRAIGGALLAGEMTARAGRGPQNSLFILFPVNRGCFMAANLKQFLETKITEIGESSPSTPAAWPRGSAL